MPSDDRSPAAEAAFILSCIRSLNNTPGSRVRAIYHNRKVQRCRRCKSMGSAEGQLHQDPTKIPK